MLLIESMILKVLEMAKVGDTVQVTIHGGDKNDTWGFGATNSTTTVGGAVSIGSGQTMTIPGKIIEDRGDSWAIELRVSISGKNIIVVPRSSQRGS